MERARKIGRNMIPLSFSSSDLKTMEKEWTQSGMKKSLSEPLLSDSEVIIEFEGDGPLGIVWEDRENDAYVLDISDRTVASEEFNLKVGYKLLQIGDYNCSHISYSDIMNLIRLKWQKFSQITLTFCTDVNDVTDLVLSEESSSESESGDVTECPIYIFLKKHNSEDFYGSFKDLGANCMEDLEFVEYQDLINMKMSSDSRKSISKELNLGKTNVYFSPHLSGEELVKEKNKYNRITSNFIEIHPNQ